MSVDRKLDWVCPHVVAEEALFLTSDRTTVKPLRPIASAASVVMRVNGEDALVGPMGHHVAGETYCKAGPYTITSGATDRLIVQVEDVLYTATVPGGTRLQPEQVVRALIPQIPLLTLAVVNGRIHVKTRNTGPTATFVVMPGSTLAPILGLPVNRQWRGRTTVPGWSLIRDATTLDDRPTRFIVFDEAIKSVSSFVEIGYATVKEECRRCGGLGIENDWRADGQGKVITVKNENLLLQEFQKAIFTIRGSNKAYPWMGTNILQVLGKKNASFGAIQQFISADIREAFRRWQGLKKQQEQNVGQEVTDEEYPVNLLQVTVSPSAENPTLAYVTAVVQNRSDKPVVIERGVRVPVSAALLNGT